MFPEGPRYPRKVDETLERSNSLRSFWKEDLRDIRWYDHVCGTLDASREHFGNIDWDAHIAVMTIKVRASDILSSSYTDPHLKASEIGYLVELLLVSGCEFGNQEDIDFIARPLNGRFCETKKITNRLVDPDTSFNEIRSILLAGLALRQIHEGGGIEPIYDMNEGLPSTDHRIIGGLIAPNLWDVNGDPYPDKLSAFADFVDKLDLDDLEDDEN